MDTSRIFKTSFFKLLFSGLVVFSIHSCSKDKPNEQQFLADGSLVLPVTPYNYEAFAQVPLFTDPFTQAQDNEPNHNKISNWGATLGRVLFYDKKLSKNQSIACASCHIQSHGFSDTARFSTGFLGGKTGRHSMSLINSRFYASGKFFWDERAETLENQVLMPIQDHVEMGMSLDSLVMVVSSQSYYPILFKKAFGNEEVNADRISKALAQFVRSIVAYNTPYHRAKGNRDPKEAFPDFSAKENLGKEIFFGLKSINCSGCHATEAFVADNPRNNGVRNGDFGVYAHNRNEQYLGAFKSTTLIDIADRGPYMHDGSFKTLKEVINHYSDSINNDDRHLDPHLVDEEGNAFRMNLSPEEKDALLAFLHTLSDDKVRTEPAYSNPFVE